jgi:hypothetical protein
MDDVVGACVGIEIAQEETRVIIVFDPNRTRQKSSLRGSSIVKPTSKNQEPRLSAVSKTALLLTYHTLPIALLWS